MSNPLGRSVDYSDQYDPALLFAVPRAAGRSAISVNAQPFNGFDYWNCFELSWLNASGKPEVAVAHISYSAETPAIVESKSLKLYLNSFAGTHFSDSKIVQQHVHDDLCRLLGTTHVSVQITPADVFERTPQPPLEAQSIDGLDVTCSVFEPQPELLTVGSTETSKRLCSNLLRTLCPVTGQPDWATVLIQYQGPQIDERSLLRYLVSFRKHQGFHESCTEKIYHDLSEHCAPRELAVLCLFSRRGGIEIHPLRTSAGMKFQYERFRLFRG